MEDYIIASKKKLVKIDKIAKKINIEKKDLILYGDYKAKIKPKMNDNDSKLILVTAINPTPFGEGKTTVAIGLHDAMWAMGKKSVLVLREPSLGPVFGIKGGATGGGYSQVLPMEDINLHFNGDFHAITSANNLISACIDNSLHHGNHLNINPSTIEFYRCLDMNDRALRDVEIGRGGKKNGIPRYEQFTITAASEMMAIFCLAQDMEDLKDRVNNIIIGKNFDGDYIYVKHLNVTGSVLALLIEAMLPNLVQTLEENPVIIHGGPFANIAHGCNSIIGTKTGLSYADYTITEAGFGSDLGALKFFDIKCRGNNLNPWAVVLICTIKALKYNGGVLVDNIKESNPGAVKNGLCNLKVHIENLKKFNVNIIVTLNKYDSDTKEEIELVKEYVTSQGIEFTINEAYAKGGKGAISIVDAIDKMKFKPLHHIYDLNDSLEDKISKVCKNIYRCQNINYNENVKNKLDEYNKLFPGYPICIAKTQYSISDDKNKLGSPFNYDITVRDLKVYNGARFITVFLGDIMTMPGLSKEPAATVIDVINDKIIGVF